MSIITDYFILSYQRHAQFACSCNHHATGNLFKNNLQMITVLIIMSASCHVKHKTPSQLKCFTPLASQYSKLLLSGDRMNPTLYATTTDTLTSAPTNAATIPYYDSNNLFKNKKIVTITHEGRSYQLRITSSNKLILTA